MQKLISVFFFILITFFICGTGFAIEYEVRTGFNYDWWESNNRDKGSQIYTPVRIGTEYKNFSFLMLTAFTNTESKPSTARDHSLSCVIDTKLNFSYTLLDKLPVAMLFGIDFNIPTGKNDIKEKKLDVIMDPDLISITRFGEGFNVNPTISIVKEWQNLAAGFGIGYLWRGEYDYSTTIHDYDPADILSITGELMYDFLPDWRIDFFCEYADYGKDEVDNHNYYQEGDFFLIGFGIDHFRTNWDASLTVKTIIRNKSKFQEESRGLVKEDKNSYGDEWIADIACRYYLNKKTTLKSLISFLWIDENDYSNASPLFIGNREKGSIGMGIARVLTAAITGEFNVNGFYIDDERNWYHDSDRTYKGFSTELRLTGNF